MHAHGEERMHYQHLLCLQHFKAAIDSLPFPAQVDAMENFYEQLQAQCSRSNSAWVEGMDWKPVPTVEPVSDNWLGSTVGWVV